MQPPPQALDRRSRPRHRRIGGDAGGDLGILSSVHFSRSKSDWCELADGPTLTIHWVRGTPRGGTHGNLDAPSPLPRHAAMSSLQFRSGIGCTLLVIACSTYGLDATSAAFEVGYECAANSVASTDSFGQPSMTDVKARLDQSALASY